jgi:hypothetical protein
LGVGALAVGAGGLVGSADAKAVAAELRYRPATDTTRFARMFPSLPVFASNTEALREALLEIGKRGGSMDAGDALEAGPKALIVDPSLSANNPNNPMHTAGTTFFGQFVDHDITFDAGSTLGEPTAPETARNYRSPALDLDSVYGAGFVAQQELYDPLDHVKLKIETGGQFEGVPRRADGAAIIADPRNDENVVISGLQEAEVVEDGLHLGPVGGTIVAEVLIGLMRTDPGSYLGNDPGWRPTLPSRTGGGDFRMTDFLSFAGVDPRARGQ